MLLLLLYVYKIGEGCEVFKEDKIPGF